MIISKYFSGFDTNQSGYEPLNLENGLSVNVSVGFEENHSTQIQLDSSLFHSNERGMAPQTR